MLIALLAVVGVDLSVVAALAGALVARRVWLRRQPGAFNGAIRLAGGELRGLRRRWRRGTGRWVRDILVWTTAPAHFRNRLISVDGLAGEVRRAKPGEIRRLGKGPVVVPVAVGGGTRIEIAVREDAGVRALGPFGKPGPAAGGGLGGLDPGRPPLRPQGSVTELQPRGKPAGPA